MSREGKTGFSQEVVAWVHSGQASNSGNSWVMLCEGAGIYIGPLRGIASREGGPVPVFNLEKRGYWGVFGEGHDESSPSWQRTLREAIELAHNKWLKLDGDRQAWRVSGRANLNSEKPDMKVVQARAKAMGRVGLRHEVEKRAVSKKPRRATMPQTDMDRPWKEGIWIQKDFG